MEKKEVVEQGEKRKGIEERERERNVLDDPHNNILSQVCWPRCSQRARPICSHHPPLSLSLFSSPPLLSLSRRTFCPIYPLCLGCNARAGKSREWEENGGGREEEGRRKRGRETQEPSVATNWHYGTRYWMYRYCLSSFFESYRRLSAFSRAHDPAEPDVPAA